MTEYEYLTALAASRQAYAALADASVAADQALRQATIDRFGTTPLPTAAEHRNEHNVAPDHMLLLLEPEIKRSAELWTQLDNALITVDELIRNKARSKDVNIATTDDACWHQGGLELYPPRIDRIRAAAAAALDEPAAAA